MITVQLNVWNASEMAVLTQALTQLAQLREKDPVNRPIGVTETVAAPVTETVTAQAPGTITVTEEAPAPAKKSRAAKAAKEPASSDSVAADPAPAPLAEAPASGTKVTLESVRSKLASLSQEGKGPAVKSLIQSFGVANLTSIPTERLPEVLEKAAAL